MKRKRNWKLTELRRLVCVSKAANGNRMKAITKVLRLGEGKKRFERQRGSQEVQVEGWARGARSPREL
jgi:hypothetical protein